MTEDWTIGRLLDWTVDYLTQHGADTPRLDAEVLLAEARQCERIELYTAFGEVAEEPTRTAFRELVRRRADGMPVAYLVGRREFYSLDFRVTPDVLIPRPETELLVMRLLDLAKESTEERPPRIADVGTGSGIIAVCAAKYLPTSSITAVDISPAALEIATQNAANHGVADRVELLQSDLLESIDPERRFDFIVSNPPYITTDEMASLMPEVKDHEPHVALVAGSTGMEIVERLLPQVAERLRGGGQFLMEINPVLREAICDLVESDGRFETPEIHKDLAGHPRVMITRRRD